MTDSPIAIITWLTTQGPQFKPVINLLNEQTRHLRDLYDVVADEAIGADPEESTIAAVRAFLMTVPILIQTEADLLRVYGKGAQEQPWFKPAGGERGVIPDHFSAALCGSGDEATGD